jgi:hypothetical protein
MKKSPLLEFRSTLFEVVEGEDQETNPGIYGKSLAAWLASQLRIPEQDVIAEDFGWCIPVKSSQHRLYVACSSEDDSKDRWRVFVFAEGGFISRLLGRDTRAAEVTAVFARIKQILEANSGISAVTEQTDQP